MQKRLLFLFMLLVGFTTAMMAQITTSGMSGKVTADGEDVIGATIEVVHVPSGTKYQAVTNAKGMYAINGMRPGGPYRVNVSYIGYQSKSFDNVSLQLGQTYNLNVGLFEDAQQLAGIMTRELSDLRAAGMKPTAGDLRCIAYGHITRMAIWNLRPLWDAQQTTEKKLAIIRVAMDAIATVDEVKSCLEGAPTPQPAIKDGLFARQETKEPLDAVTF